MPNVSSSAPLDPREFHGYYDAPRHTLFIVVGWCVAGVLSFFGLYGVMMLGVPSDPCVPGDTECGPEPTTFAAVGLVLLLAAAAVGGWSVFWRHRDRRYRFEPPPSWPPVPEGWRPGPGWAPPPTFPKAPEGWRFWR